jgi:uncharacterized protein YcbK (DUF882 family)
MQSFLAALVLLISSVPAAPTVPAPRDYRVRFFHTHTGERLDIVYRRGDRYVPGALDQLNRYLRDHRTNDVHPYDPQVFDLLHDLLASVGRPNGEIDVICGYRTPKSNAYLRANTTGVAENSLHMRALAIDIRIPGVSTAKLREAALALQRGGVGYYPKSGFVHVDVGRVRRW